ncbi:MAG: hypothetical protein J6K58_14495 [Lachnospiraceae bacterium]|nr:hypothetical protein [Lachnospiraceae bacterium]
MPTQESLKEEFDNAGQFGEIRVGKDHLFYRSFIRVRFVPFRECSRIFLRIEFGEYGEFPVHEHYIIAKTRQEEEFALRLDRPDDAKNVMVFLAKNHKGIELGKDREK